MIEAADASRVLGVISKDIAGVSMDQKNFQKLPDSFWGYFARGHDSKGTFGVIVTYSEDGSDVDNMIKMYEEWVAKNKSE